jgi:hypothetical protein
MNGSEAQKEEPIISSFMLQHTCEVKNHFKLALEASKESY